MPFRVPKNLGNFNDGLLGRDPNPVEVEEYLEWLRREVYLCQTFLMPVETVKLPDEEVSEANQKKKKS
jgi:hypothetical protein